MEEEGGIVFTLAELQSKLRHIIFQSLTCVDLFGSPMLAYDQTFSFLLSLPLNLKKKRF